MSSIRKHVPPGKGRPAPEPPNTADKAVAETGPNRHRIAAYLDELTEIVEVDWAYQHLIPRRNAIFVALRKMGVTLGRMQRSYAIDGKPLITHVGIKKILDRAGVPVGRVTPNNEEEEE